MITKEMLDNWFTYHPPRPDQIPRYEKIRDAARVFAQIVVNNTPACADQSAAIRLLRECVMTANAAIAIETSKAELEKSLKPIQGLKITSYSSSSGIIGAVAEFGGQQIAHMEVSTDDLYTLRTGEVIDMAEKMKGDFVADVMAGLDKTDTGSVVYTAPQVRWMLEDVFKQR